MGPLERTILLGVKLDPAANMDAAGEERREGGGRGGRRLRRGQRLTVHLRQRRSEEEPAAAFDLPVLAREWSTVELRVELQKKKKITVELG